MRIKLSRLIMLILLFASPATGIIDAQNNEILTHTDIGYVPAGFPVNFSLLTHGNRQYVAYYD